MIHIFEENQEENASHHTGNGHIAFIRGLHHQRPARTDVQELGKVLSRILAGDVNADLSGLPEKWRKAAEKELKS